MMKFYRQLEKTPEKMGHYGENENIYSYGEYVEMIQLKLFFIGKPILYVMKRFSLLQTTIVADK